MVDATARCTKHRPARITPNKTVSNQGPDDGWQLLTSAEVRAFGLGEGKNLIHRGRPEFDHVCARKGNWAFDVDDPASPVTVAFLHYKQPVKLMQQLGVGPGVFQFSGDDLIARYNTLVVADSGRANVWKRASQGEIAIDFCMFAGLHWPAHG